MSIVIDANQLFEMLNYWDSCLDLTGVLGRNGVILVTFLRRFRLKLLVLIAIDGTFSYNLWTSRKRQDRNWKNY